MDKSIELSRFSPAKPPIRKQSGPSGGYRKVGFMEKSKKPRLRRMSVIGRINSTNQDSGEDELPTNSISKTFLVPRKFIDDCNTVHGTSVPQKQRSPMKKRNLESISPPIPDTEKMHVINGVELSGKSGLKKSKLNSQKRDLDGSLAPITKDEEEVVETLYALAVLFPNNDNEKKTALDGEMSETKSEGESTVPPIEVAKTEDHSKTNPSLYSEGSATATVEVEAVNESSEPGSPKCNQLHNGLDNIVPLLNPQTVASFVTSAATDGKPLSSSVGFDFPSNPILGSRSSAAKIPAWLSNYSSSVQPASSETVVSTKKEDCEVMAEGKKSWKRCEAHGHISRLIKVLQHSERRDTFPLQLTKLKANEVTKRGVLIQGLRNDLNGIASPSEKNSDEVRNAILLHKRLVQEQQHEDFDFLSFPAGGGRTEADNSSSNNRRRNDLEPPLQSHVPHLQLLPQNHPVMAFFFSHPRNCDSTTFSNHFSLIAIQQRQAPPYLGSNPPYGTPHLGRTASVKQQQPEQLGWTAARFAAYYKTEGISLPHHIQNMPSEDYHYKYAQAIVPPPHSSLQVLGPHKYDQISRRRRQQQQQQQEEQQQFMCLATSTLPPSRVTREYHNLPSRYEGNGSGFCIDSPP